MFVNKIGAPLSAKNILDMYWDGSLPVNPISIAQSMGVQVYKNPELSVSGMFTYLHDDVPTIIYNSEEPPTRQRFTIAHELGHYALQHPGDKFRDGSRSFNLHNYEPAEVGANRFAAELLMPAEAVKRHAMRIGQDLNSLTELFGVSMTAMNIRLQALGII